MQLGHKAAALAQHINIGPTDKAKALKINLPPTRTSLQEAKKRREIAGANISRSFLRNLKTSNIQLNLPQAFILNL